VRIYKFDREAHAYARISSSSGVFFGDESIIL